MTENSKLPDSSEVWTLPYLQFAAILFTGLEKLAEIQKSALSVYNDIAKNAADSIKPTVPLSTMSLYELSEQAIREFLQIQVRLLDLMLKQSTAKRGALQTSAGNDFEGDIARLMLDSTDCLLNMQKKALEFITHQNETLAEDILQNGSNGTQQNSNERMPPDTSAIIQAQKKFWEVTLKPFRAMDQGI